MQELNDMELEQMSSGKVYGKIFVAGVVTGFSEFLDLLGYRKSVKK